MSTFRQMVKRSRVRLGSPRSQAPSDRQLLLLISTNIQSFINESGLNGSAWAVDELPLTVAAGIEDYAIAEGSYFGKPIQVRTVYPENPAHIERDVEFFELGDINYDWNYPKNFGALVSNYDGSPHTAQRIAFFRKSGTDQVYARVQPVPQRAATYQVLYQIGDFGSVLSLDTAPLLPQHHALIELRSCIDALPHCDWDDDEAINESKRKQLALTFVPRSEQLERNFKTYLRQQTVSRRLSERILYEIDV